MNDKIKNKIEKLLNLSMSDNEHEAILALEKALKLMNEHNITKDEVYRQNFINKTFEIDNAVLPDWKIELYSAMANVSGCVFTWKNGFRYSNTRREKVKGQITGRERDVENAVYLCEFLIREVEKKEKTKKNELKDKGILGIKLSQYLKSFKKGIIYIVFQRLYEQQNKFFNTQKETGLICVDIKSKVKDSEDFLNGKFRLHNSKAKNDKKAMNDGINVGKDIELNQAVSKQDEIKMIG